MMNIPPPKRNFEVLDMSFTSIKQLEMNICQLFYVLCVCTPDPLILSLALLRDIVFSLYFIQGKSRNSQKEISNVTQEILKRHLNEILSEQSQRLAKQSSDVPAKELVNLDLPTI